MDGGMLGALLAPSGSGGGDRSPSPSSSSSEATGAERWAGMLKLTSSSEGNRARLATPSVTAIPSPVASCSLDAMADESVGNGGARRVNTAGESSRCLTVSAPGSHDSARSTDRNSFTVLTSAQVGGRAECSGEVGLQPHVASKTRRRSSSPSQTSASQKMEP